MLTRGMRLKEVGRQQLQPPLQIRRSAAPVQICVSVHVILSLIAPVDDVVFAVVVGELALLPQRAALPFLLRRCLLPAPVLI